jgi:amidase
VAVWLDSAVCPLAAEVEERLRAAIEVVARAGAAVDEKQRPVDAAQSFSVYLRLLFGVIANGFPPGALANFDAALPGVAADDTSFAAEAIRGSSQRHRAWQVDDERRHRLRLDWQRFFRDFDVLLAPVMPTVAFPHDHSEQTTRTIAVDGGTLPYMHQLFWAGLATVAQLPAVAAPVGLARSGLPVGLQIVAPYLEDRTAIRFAELLAAEIGGFQAPPGFA